MGTGGIPTTDKIPETTEKLGFPTDNIPETTEIFECPTENIPDNRVFKTLNLRKFSCSCMVIGEYDLTLENHLKSLAIRKLSLPLNHPDIATF